MKKTPKLFVALFTASLAMSSCNLIASDDAKPEQTTTESSTSASTSRTSSSEESSITDTSHSDVVYSVEATDGGVYHIGQNYAADANPTIEVTYIDGYKEKIDTFTVKSVKDPNGTSVNKSAAFTKSGNYTATIGVTVGSKSYTKTVSFSVKSGTEETSGYSLTNISLEMPKYSAGQTVTSQLSNIQLTLTWNKGTEYYNYTYSTDTKFTITLKQDGGAVALTTPIQEGHSYTLTFSFKGYSKGFDFSLNQNYYRLAQDDITIVSSDFDNDYAQSKGEVKMLVIPITLSGSYTDTWSSSQLSNLNNYYFGNIANKVSLKSYYETASFGQMTVSGMVTETYVETSSTYTTDNILNDDNKRLDLISRAVTKIENDHSEIDFSAYDLNDDGCLDNVHLITNFNTKTYQSQTGSSAWGLPLWPHMSKTDNTSGTLSKPVANVYSLSAIDHVSDAITAIHEQGHIFGLVDYYDYSDDGVDYVGHADMQSANIFDWNSYSKLSMGWVSPYVATGACEITMSAASINGDCLIVPANPSTFNNSAFDEYFLIELFSPYGNNAIQYPYNGNYSGLSCWEFWETYYGGSLGGYGVRLYHVDSRFGYYNGASLVPTDTLSNPYNYILTDNNSYDYERHSVFSPYKDFKLLSIMQKGKTDTFGNKSYSSHLLNGDDLFKQGDTFKFSDYKHFLSKSGKTVTTMDNGESFPYKIEFTSMSATSVTVKISLA